jgi:hypothetical protein
MTVEPTSLYERDFYAWANQQATLLRTGKLSDADIAHIAEEIESMGKAEKRELVSRLTVLLAHLLKWRYQPPYRGPSWEVTIRNQRRDLTDHLADNPSLSARLPEALASSYERAVDNAYAETGLPKATFPPHCPWPFDQILDAQFWPDAGTP